MAAIPKLKSKITKYVAAVLLAVIGISAWSIYSQYAEIIGSAEQRAEDYARTLAQHSESAFAEADRILLDTLQEMSLGGGIEKSSPSALFDLLKRQVQGAPQIGAAFVVDREGNMLANSGQFPQAPINVLDRDYFQNYLKSPDAELTLSKPVMSRLVNRWRFNLMRPLPEKNDSFNGLLAAAFEVSYFKDFLGTTSLGPKGRVMLVRNDGVPLVFEPYIEKAYDSDLKSTYLFTRKLPASPHGTYMSDENSGDTEPRIISYRRLNRFPIIAVVAIHKEDILGSWVNKSIFQSIMTVGLCFVIAILVRLMFRHLDTLHDTRTVMSEQEEELRIKAAQIDAATDAILQVDSQGRLVHFNHALCSMTGYSREELTDGMLKDIEPPDYSSRIPLNIRTLQELGQATFESAYMAKDGAIIPIEVHARTMESDGNRLILSIVRDISQRKRSEIKDQARLKILEGMATGSSLTELLELIVKFVEQNNPGSICSILLADENREHLLHGAAPNLPDFYNKAVNGLKIGQGIGSCGTAAFTKKRVIVEKIEGHSYWRGFKPAQEAGLQACWSEPVISSDGELLGTFATYFREPRSPGDDEIQFIESAAHLASIAISRVRDEHLRKKLEEQLLHIQKIEAIGQLAGGIAHDFNNLLTPILIYSEIIGRALTAEHPQFRRLEGIIAAALRARDLTGKLLSFSRKQVLKMEVLDLNEVIDAFRDIMQRTIRQNIIIDVKPAPGAARIQADRGQLEQVLLNLTINAQDAIDGGGTISVTTGHILLDDEYVRQHHGMASGPYILLSFTDDGCGMDEKTMSRIFEPFFTTKAPGHGTGLGLATVYGIIKQHAGYIEARSNIGKGTSFLIYLPVTEKMMAAEVEPAAAVDDYRSHKAVPASILLVEDNAMVREMAVDLLESEGYNVLAADSPLTARQIENSFDGTIDLLLTDIVMPDMNGRELYDIIREKRPAIKILYISGYTSGAVIHGEDLNFLKKPFTVEQLIDKVKLVMSET